MLNSRIGYWIEKSGYKKKYIASVLEVTPTQLSNWVSGRSYPTAEKLFRLAELLGCKVDDFYNNEEDKNE